MTFDLAAIGAGLPVAASVPALRAALAQAGAAAVVHAPPGTGKTTLVPPLLADLLGDSRRAGRVVVTAPRRIAVRAAAARLAQLDGSPVGERVGFTVRGQRRSGRDTRVEFCTPGVLLRRLLADPELPGVGAVALDEVHERSLETDLLVGMLAQVRQLRDDLRLVAMSATLDAPRFAALLGDEAGDGEPAPVVDCPSALHPLEVRWRRAPGPRFDARGVSREFLAHVAQVAVDAAGQAPQSDALVFLPGAWEVSQVAGSLRRALPRSDVLELHGRVPPAEQDRVIRGRRPDEPARVVVSTAVAESSLTVPGVRLVIDAGLSREPRRDAARGMSGLVTVAASRDAAVERAGRAARLGPGQVVRCYDEETFARMPAHVTSQIASADLTQAALLLACWGTPGGRGLPLPDPPPAAALADAHAVLRGLGALEATGPVETRVDGRPEGRIGAGTDGRRVGSADGPADAPADASGMRVTATGRALAALPVDPRLGRALLDGSALVGARRAAEVVAALADDLRPDGGDLPGLLRRLRAGHAPGAATWQAQLRRLEALAGSRPGDTAPQPPESSPAAVDTLRAGVDVSPGSVDPGAAIGIVVALAYPERVARREGEVYLLASGTRAALPTASPLRGSDWLAVADVSRTSGAAAAGTGAVIRVAAPVTRADAELAAAALHTDDVRATWREGRVTARRVEALGAIELAVTPVKASRAAAREAVLDALRADGLGLLTWSPGAADLRRRMAFLHHHVGGAWPAIGDAALTADLPTWLGPEIERLADGTRADRIDLHDPLRRLLPWADGTAARLDDLAPARLPVPSGRTAAIAYPSVEDPDERPVVAVKLQECFGLADTPRLADGRVPVLFHLLSPAGRPLAVTDDLASFWSGPYQQVRSEMRGRYPRHPWPDDPWTVPATARTKARAHRDR